jgi:hypothetical protein
MNIQALILWLTGLIYLLFLKDGRRYQVLGLTYLFTVLILMLLSGKHYYTLGAYPMLFAAGGVAVEKLCARRLRILKPAKLVLMLLLFLPALPHALPVLPLEKMAAYAQHSKKFGLEGTLVWEDGRVHALPQDYADMTGWRELAGIVIQAYDGLSDAEKAQCTIYGDNYGHAGAIRYYGKKYGLPEPVSFHESFTFWVPDNGDLAVLIYVNDELGEDIQHYFGEVTLAGTVKDPYFRESGVQVYVCKNPRNGFAEFLTEKVRAMKSRYQR